MPKPDHFQIPKIMTTALATKENKPSALRTMASRLNVEPDVLLNTLKQTVCKGCTDSEMMAFSIVANEYKLNPFIKHIYAFPAKGGGIVPVVSVDGWITMANNHPQMDGVEFVDEHDESGNLVAIACTIYRKDRTRPIRAKEYLEECKRATDPWKMPHRMLRHKAMIQTCRIAFGFSGLYDEDEAAEIARNGGMRETSGRVVPTENPYEESATPATTPEVKPAPKKNRGKAPAEDAPAEQQPPAQDAVVIPTRQAMYVGLKAACAEAEISPQSAEARFRKEGLIPAGKTLAETTDEELFEIYEARTRILPPVQKTQNAEGGNDQ